MASSKSRRNARPKDDGKLNWADQIKTFYQASTSVPAKEFLKDIFVPTKGKQITEENLSPEAVSLLAQMSKDKKVKAGDVFSFSYDDYNKYGAQLSALFQGKGGEDVHKNFVQRLANLSPADELKFTLGETSIKVDKDGIARAVDQYDFNTWADFSAEPDENGVYPTYTPEEFEKLGLSFADAIEKTVRNSPSNYQMIRNIGFLLGSKDYKDNVKDKGRKVEINLGAVVEPTGLAVKESKRPRARVKDRITLDLSPEAPTENDIMSYLEKAPKRELAPEKSIRPQERPRDETAELFGEVSRYLDELPERELAPQESLRPQARPRDETEELLSEPKEAEEKTLAPQSSMRPQARPTAQVEDSQSVDTDSMSFGDAFKYYTDETDQDVFEWRGKKYKAERKFAEGGMVDRQMTKLYQEGGLADDGARVEPVTGNEVPPGSMAEEVRDDVNAKLSEGEYVLPADVVRFIGLGQIERMVAKAKKGLEEMDANGRIGGEPVNEDGVPMEDDELTPEEMQMLAEALGQAPTGMAMGGMVTPDPYQQQQMQYTQPVGMAEGGLTPAAPFNPSQYQFGGPSGSMGSSGGIQVVEYINTDTGETRLVSILNGKPMGVVPPGFVPSTPEAVAQAQKNSQKVETKTEGTTDVLSPGNDSESDQRRAEQANQTSSEGGYDKWASENYDDIVKNPLEYVEGQLGKEDELLDKAIKAGTLALGSTMGPLGMALGVGVSAIKELTPLSNARAALDLAKEQGVSQDILDEMTTKIEKYEDALPRGLDLIDNSVAPGTMKSSALKKYGATSTTKSEAKPSTKLFVPSTQKPAQTEDGAREEQLAQERYEEFQKDYEKNVKDAEENQYGQTTGKGLTVEDIEDSLTPMAKGGFVSKPSNYKSKVTRKKENKRRGLGSK